MDTQDKERYWVINYLLNNVDACVTNEAFHEEFHKLFGGARTEKLWGAQPVRRAQKILMELAKTGVAKVTRVPLGNGLGPGYPNWVRSYSISPFGREVYGSSPMYGTGVKYKSVGQAVALI